MSYDISFWNEKKNSNACTAWLLNWNTFSETTANIVLH